MLLRAIFLVPFVTHVFAGLVNVTIDDQSGDPTTGGHINYTPSDAWQVGQTCQSCTAKPAPADDAYMGTWTDASFNPSGTSTNDDPGEIIRASVSFVGVAVYVNVILTGSETSPDGNSDFTFLIDNVTKGTFEKAPDGDTTYHFNQTIFSITGLTNASHTITIEAGHSGNKSLVLLDSIVYTKDTGDSGSSSGTNSTTSSSGSSGTSTSSSTTVSSTTQSSTVSKTTTSSSTSTLATLTLSSTASAASSTNSTSSGYKLSALSSPLTCIFAFALCLVV